MKVKNQKRLFNGLKGLAAAVALTAGVFVISSFDDSGSSASGGSSGFLFKTDPPEDCSTSVIVYNYNYSSGSGGGSISGNGNATGGGGTISGSGASTTVQTGPKGTVYTPQSKTDCSLSWNADCHDVACHATGAAKFTPF
jgi:hypothetical protein